MPRSIVFARLWCDTDKPIGDVPLIDANQAWIMTNVTVLSLKFACMHSCIHRRIHILKFRGEAVPLAPNLPFSPPLLCPLVPSHHPPLPSCPFPTFIGVLSLSINPAAEYMDSLYMPPMSHSSSKAHMELGTCQFCIINYSHFTVQHCSLLQMHIQVGPKSKPLSRIIIKSY